MLTRCSVARSATALCARPALFDARRGSQSRGWPVPVNSAGFPLTRSSRFAPFPSGRNPWQGFQSIGGLLWSAAFSHATTAPSVITHLPLVTPQARRLEPLAGVPVRRGPALVIHSRILPRPSYASTAQTSSRTTPLQACTPSRPPMPFCHPLRRVLFRGCCCSPAARYSLASGEEVKRKKESANPAIATKRR